MRTGTLGRGLLRALALCLPALAGCAVHPLPQDTARLDTVEIVEHIRCEMYDAMRRQIVLIFDRTGTEAAQAVAREIEANPEQPLQNFQSKVALLKPEYQQRIKAYRATTIGYGFRFNITEQDIAKAEGNFGLPWNGLSNFQLKTAAGLDKRRTNTRRFFKVDSFEELLLSKDCLTRKLNAANLVYPITGSIGLKDTVDDFFKLTTRGARTETADPKDVRSFSEQLSFTTIVSGSITPKIKLAPLTDHFKLADATADLQAIRTDVHELTLTFDVGKGFDARGGVASAAERRDAVVQELDKLRIIDAVERGGGAVAVPVTAP